MDLFLDRRDAGRKLADKLSNVDSEGEICVLALPRGGVPVALEVAASLNAPLDLLFVKKIGAPGEPELALGAVSEGGEVHWKREILDYLSIPPAKLEKLAEAKRAELRERLKQWRAGRKPLDVSEKTVIVADDGLATGATMAAALKYLRTQRPKKIVVAVPTASHEAVETIRTLCDELIVLATPEPFISVGQWYRHFDQVSDEEVRSSLLNRPALSRCGRSFLPR